jgi:hypothetical protein
MVMASDRDEGRPMPLMPPETRDYEQLIDDYSHFAPPAEGEVLEGHVLKVTPTEVIVDFGYKSEGLVPIAQLTHPDGSVTVRPGDTIDVVIDRKGEEPEGYILLSHERAGRIRAWDTLEKAYREHLLVSGRVMGRIKGGLGVDVGVQAFMPSSQSDLHLGHKVDSLIGQDIAVLHHEALDDGKQILQGEGLGQESVGPHQQHQWPEQAMAAPQPLQGGYRVAGDAGLDLGRVDQILGVAGGRQAHHGQPIAGTGGGWCPVRRNTGGNPDDAAQVQLSAGLLGKAQMGIVDRVEGATQDAQGRARTHLPPGRGKHLDS